MQGVVEPDCTRYSPHRYERAPTLYSHNAKLPQSGSQPRRTDELLKKYIVDLSVALSSKYHYPFQKFISFIGYFNSRFAIIVVKIAKRELFLKECTVNCQVCIDLYGMYNFYCQVRIDLHGMYSFSMK